jgi:hypothetical protein
MNTQVKVGIAAAIVAALVALIVLDQKTTPKDEAAQKGSSGGDPATIIGTNSSTADGPATRLREDEIKDLLKSAEKQFGDSKPATSPGPVKGSEEKNEKRVSSTATGEEYVIKEGDTLDGIAQRTLGGKAYASKILKDQLSIFINFDEDVEPQEEAEPEEERERFNENLYRSVDELELSVRSANCLKNAGIKLIGELVSRSEAEMLKTQNFGRKSLNEIKDILVDMGLTLGMKLDNFPDPEIMRRLRGEQKEE